MKLYIITLKPKRNIFLMICFQSSGRGWWSTKLTKEFATIIIPLSREQLEALSWLKKKKKSV